LKPEDEVSDSSDQEAFVKRVREQLDQNQEVDNQLAKDRLKNKRIRRKQQIKRELGIADKETNDNGVELGPGSEDEASDDEEVEGHSESEESDVSSLEPPKKR